MATTTPVINVDKEALSKFAATNSITLSKECSGSTKTLYAAISANDIIDVLQSLGISGVTDVKFPAPIKSIGNFIVSAEGVDIAVNVVEASVPEDNQK